VDALVPERVFVGPDASVDGGFIVIVALDGSIDAAAGVCGTSIVGAWVAIVAYPLHVSAPDRWDAIVDGSLVHVIASDRDIQASPGRSFASLVY
jgi:hypothetical protein